jgi:RNA polymerase sigma factor (sigma-70 family)
MTTALTGTSVLSDAELATSAAAGDRAALAEIYQRYADRLRNFCIGIVRDNDVADDCVQEVFCIASVQLRTLREPASLRAWLYTIARNEAVRHLRERRRVDVADELPDVVSLELGPETHARRAELIALVAQAAAGLSERDRAVLELTYRRGLDGPELARALGVTPGHANRMVSRLRQTVEHSLTAILMARHAQTSNTGCAELQSILDGWNGHFSIVMRKRLARHIDSCAPCVRERQRLVNPEALIKWWYSSPRPSGRVSTRQTASFTRN